MREPQTLHFLQQSMYDTADDFIKYNAHMYPDSPFPVVTIQQFESYLTNKTRNIIEGRLPAEMIRFIAAEALLQGIVGKRDVVAEPKVVFNLNTAQLPFFGHLGRIPTGYMCRYELPSNLDETAEVAGCNPYILLCLAEQNVRKEFFTHAASN